MHKREEKAMEAKVVDTLEMRAENTSFQKVPPSTGELAGTLLTYSFEVFKNTVKVGRGTGHCVVVDAETVHCFNSLTLFGQGNIEFGGSEAITIDERGRISPVPSEVSVLGGTGHFAGVAGTASLGPVHGSEPLEHRLVFHLLWPWPPSARGEGQ
jgi:hypothetical protein